MIRIIPFKGLLVRVLPIHSIKCNHSLSANRLLVSSFVDPGSLYLLQNQRPDTLCPELFRYSLEPGLIDEIHRATNGNFVLGNERFKEEISMVLGKRVTPGKAGRPVKNRK